MGPFEFGEWSALCSYVRTKYEERAETMGKRRRSASDAATMTLERKQKYGKLHKPPTVQSLHERQERPRNRLQKSRPQSVVSAMPPTAPQLFVLEYDPYPYNTRPGQFLGVFSSINTVTAGAFRHGAYSFSREGLLDGSEYLSPTGRIKIVSLPVQSTGVTAAVPGETAKKDSQPMRLDIPHPLTQQAPRFDSHQDLSKAKRSDETVYLALHESPQSAFCIGLFTSKSLAWGACLKDKAWLEWTDKLVEQERSVGDDNAPRVSGRLVGSGRHCWFVKALRVDDMGK